MGAANDTMTGYERRWSEAEAATLRADGWRTTAMTAKGRARWGSRLSLPVSLSKTFDGVVAEYGDWMLFYTDVRTASESAREEMVYCVLEFALRALDPRVLSDLDAACVWYKDRLLG